MTGYEIMMTFCTSQYRHFHRLRKEALSYLMMMIFGLWKQLL